MTTENDFHTKIDELADGVVRLEFSMEPIDRSDFPHSLVTVDYALDGEVIGITAVGHMSDEVIRRWAEWRSCYRPGEKRDLSKLVEELRPSGPEDRIGGAIPS